MRVLGEDDVVGRVEDPKEAGAEAVVDAGVLGGLVGEGVEDVVNEVAERIGFEAVVVVEAGVGVGELLDG